jgi:hypothetical protein
LTDSSEDVLENINFAKDELEKVETKIKEMCQPLNVSKLNEIKNEFKALTMISKIKCLIQDQQKVQKSIPNILETLPRLPPNSKYQFMFSLFFKLTRFQITLFSIKLIMKINSSFLDFLRDIQ